MILDYYDMILDFMFKHKQVSTGVFIYIFHIPALQFILVEDSTPPLKGKNSSWLPKRGSLMCYSLIHPTQAINQTLLNAIQMKYDTNTLLRQYSRNSNTVKALLCLCRICFKSNCNKYFTMSIKNKSQVQRCVLDVVCNCFLHREYLYNLALKIVMNCNFTVFFVYLYAV